MSLASAASLTRPDVVPQLSRLSFKVNNFDLIRLFAAIQVAVFHCYHRYDIAIPAAMVPFGWFPGVPIFFVISGYLISASFERSTSLRTYARNRAMRIFPALWGVLALTVLAMVAFGDFSFAPRDIGWLLLQMIGLIFTPQFLVGFGDGTYNGSLWTIPIELQFYVALPVLYLLLARSRNPRRGAVLMFAVVLAVGIAVVFLFPALATSHESRIDKLVRYTFVPRFYLFVFGVLLQRLQVHVSPWIRDRGLYWLAAYILFNLVAPIDGLMYMVGELFLALTMISLAYTAPTIAERVLRGNDISYGAYLYHGLLINILIELAFPRNGWLLPLTLALTIVLAYFSWIAIERPAIRRKRPNQARQVSRGSVGPL